MKYFLSFLLLFSLINCQSTAVVSKHVKGQIIRHENFNSKFIKARHVDVWLPKNYKKNEKYAVVYMHDGQMLFDSTKTWNKQAWDVDKTATDLMKSNITRDFIVVGIWNIPENRHTDYFPQKPYELILSEQKDKINQELMSKGRIKQIFQPQSDNYLKFIVEELKPFIEKTYAVSSKKEDNFIMGSSMGGLISMYAVMEYPEIFGGAGCLSTHWIGTWQDQDNPIPKAFALYVEQKIHSLKNNKFYFDYGDQTLDALYPKHQQIIDVIFEKNYNKRLWQTLYFPGQDHSENAWKQRLNAPLTFLLKN
jgi:predicted alpha/beta superfamily hydrolase